MMNGIITLREEVRRNIGGSEIGKRKKEAQKYNGNLLYFLDTTSFFFPFLKWETCVVAL